MRRWLPVVALVCAAAACDNPREVAAPTRPAYLTSQSSLFDAALSGHLCRCTGYQGIVTAVKLAAGSEP